MEHLLLECSVRMTLIAGATAGILWLLRVRTASARHAAWTGVLALMLLLPAWTMWGPRAALPVLPASSVVEQPAMIAPMEAPTAAVVTNFAPEPAPVSSRWNWTDALLGIYLLGAGWLLLRLAIGTIRAHRLTSAECVAPITVGLLKPRIILPQDWESWPREQIDAVLTHERAHAQRRDPLVQWLALLNRALFWFHPLAWWLERRLAALAEEACDAAVLEGGHDAGGYAECLLAMERNVSRAGARLAIGMAMPGSALPERIKQIFDGAPTRTPRWRIAVAALACSVVAIFFAGGKLAAQVAQAARLEFDAVSIKPTKPTGGGAIPIGRSGNPGSVTLLGTTAKEVIARAYSLGGYLISGPAWIEEERYDIAARVGRPASDEEQRLMLRSMLADRFQLTAHKETRVLPAYELVVGKDGPKLHAATPDEIGSRVFPNAPGVLAKQISMQRFVQLLSTKLDRPVADNTGVSGVFDIELKWAPDTALQDADPGPSVFAAIQEQLGLKLQTRNLPMEVLVIDHISKPTAN